MDDHDSIRILMDKLLHKTINDYLWYSKNNDEEIFQDARDWLFDNVEDGLMSFDNVCETLKLDKKRLRFLVNCRMDQGKRRLLDFEYGDLITKCQECEETYIESCLYKEKSDDDLVGG